MRQSWLFVGNHPEMIVIPLTLAKTFGRVSPMTGVRANSENILLSRLHPPGTRRGLMPEVLLSAFS
jgi:hypothetical protein